MRNNLFRGKRLDNGEWVFGDLVHSLYKKGDTCVGQYGNDIGMHQVDPETVGQYAERDDIHGKKIFDGDIIWLGFKVMSDDGEERVVRHERYIFDIRKHSDILDICAVEVVGNIHDAYEQERTKSS